SDRDKTRSHCQPIGISGRLIPFDEENERMKKSVWIAGIVVIIVAAGVAAVLSRGKTSDQKYRKARVDKGEVVSTVTATGTLSAVTTVSVGSQVSGIIAKLYADFNSQVKKGQ